MTEALITKVFKFEAAHKLPNHNGKCSREHGHSYKVEVSIQGPISDDYYSSSRGMVVDFYDLKEVWEPLEEKVLDHHYLNNTIPLEFQPTTAENIARFIFFKFNKKFKVFSVSVWETETGCATVYSESL